MTFCWDLYADCTTMMEKCWLYVLQLKKEAAGENNISGASGWLTGFSEISQSYPGEHQQATCHNDEFD